MESTWFKRRKWIFWVVFVAPIAIAIFIVIGGGAVMLLWNWLLPELFGLRPVTFWQALGLLALCRILFGNVGGHGPRGAHSGRHAAEHWERLTPDERERFRQGLSSQGGGSGSDEPA